MTELATTADQVRNIIAEHLGVDLDKVTDAAKLHDDLGADSLDDVELAIAMEETFGIEIDDDAMLGADTVGEMIKIVCGKVVA